MPGIAPMDARLQGTGGVKGRPKAKRGAETGDGAELVEATPKVAIAATAPRSDP
ncbi:MAG: hypothetical protein IVW52_19910 [Acidimicrobiales bacterium]|nr:hypothetical protein [Acidimicrobiales bacterium]